MKKVMLSAVLGMFCYCTNNATDPNEEEKEIKDIDDVFDIMLINQIKIFNAKGAIKNYDKKIYFKMKGEEEEKINKKNVSDFIRNQIFSDEQNEEGFEDEINKIEQYFHLEKLKLTDECNKENLTDIFWDNEALNYDITEEEKNDIKAYFMAIIQAEKQTSEAFKKYYEIKKEENKGAQDKDILKEIMKDCYGKKEQGDIVTRIIEYWRKTWSEKNIEAKNTILTTMRTRISLGTGTPENDFIYFLKQKIGIEEKKEGGCCHCCDCF